MAIVEVLNLSKSYGSTAGSPPGGPLKAVDDFSMTAEKGQILALAGPDGAGKTSIFRAVCGLIRYDAGRITIAGHDIASDFDKVKPLLGYMPQTFSLYPDLSVEENLFFYAGLFGLNRREFDRKKQVLYEFSGLGPFRDRRAAALSGGMKQKLALSCALVHDPEVLVLDEPTTGVDPLSRRQFWDILKSLRDDGSAIVVSTPYMDEVALANRVIFIHQGRRLSEGTPEELVKQFHGKVYRVNVEPAPMAMKQLNDIEGLYARRFGSTVHIYTVENRDIDDYAEELRGTGIEPDLVEAIEAELEDTFIQLMGR